MQYLCYVFEIVHRISEKNALLLYGKTCHIYCRHVCNQRRSVISAYLLIIEASKINTSYGGATGSRLKCFHDIITEIVRETCNQSNQINK